MKKTILEIDLKALGHNFNVISSKLSSKTKFMAVVKANGYGSNSVEIAKRLEFLGVDYFAVAFVSEGVALRKSSYYNIELAISGINKSNIVNFINFEEIHGSFKNGF